MHHIWRLPGPPRGLFRAPLAPRNFAVCGGFATPSGPPGRLLRGAGGPSGLRPARRLLGVPWAPVGRPWRRSPGGFSPRLSGLGYRVAPAPGARVRGPPGRRPCGGLWPRPGPPGVGPGFGAAPPVPAPPCGLCGLPAGVVGLAALRVGPVPVASPPGPPLAPRGPCGPRRALRARPAPSLRGRAGRARGAAFSARARPRRWGFPGAGAAGASGAKKGRFGTF